MEEEGNIISLFHYTGAIVLEIVSSHTVKPKTAFYVKSYLWYQIIYPTQ